MQNKDIEGDEAFSTVELVNYGYVIQQIYEEAFEEVFNGQERYCISEWYDRLSGIRGRPSNPGSSHRSRPEVWQQFLNEEGKFDYTYSERLKLFSHLIATLSHDKGTRRAWYPIFWDYDIRKAREKVRVPCSLGYNFQIRNDKLHITYIMRSCDFYTHWAIDVYLAWRLQKYVANELKTEVGTFTHFIMSLHVYQKDVVGTF